MRQADYVARLRVDLVTARERPRALVGSLRADQRTWHPPTGGWSADEVLEHLCAVGSPYLGVLEGKAAAPGPLAGPEEPWEGRIGGRLLVWSFGLKRRLPTFRAFEHPEPRPGVLEALEDQLARVHWLLERSAGLAWRRVRFASPFSAAVGLNMGDAFGVLIYHALRHYRQIERVIAAVGFPT